MGRSESKQVTQQSLDTSKNFQNQANQSFAATQGAIGDYQNRLNNFLARNPYTPGGEFQRNQNLINASTAEAGNAAMKNTLDLASQRSGENTAGFASNVAEAQRQTSRDLADQMAKADQARVDKETGIQQFGVQASALPADMQAKLYGTGAGEAVGALNPAANAAKTPGFWDEFAPALAGAAGSVLHGACPCAGSLIRMADGSDKRVEDLREGDYLWPLSFSAPPNQVLDTPQPQSAHCGVIATEGGRRHRGSETHTIALAIGGYAYLPELAGKTVLAELGTETVLAVEDIGEQIVYPLRLNGSHMYMADGIWVMA